MTENLDSKPDYQLIIERARDAIQRQAFIDGFVVGFATGCTFVTAALVYIVVAGM